MKNQEERRGFLKKVTIGLTSLVAMPLFGFDKYKLRKMENNTQKHPIRKVKALGFQWETSDPFLFCVHHDDKFPKGNKNMGPETELLRGRHIGQDFIVKDGFRMYHGKEVPGFPGHPHRGFETITVVREGMVDHADSTGAAGRYGNGDVQWMTAGKGVQHSEMFPLIHADKENPMELFQIWLNLPKKSKMVAPHFKMLWSEDIPVITSNDNNNNTTTLEVLAGKFNTYSAPTAPPNSWANEDENYVAVYNLKFDIEAEFVLPATVKGVNRTLYYYTGNQLKINGEEIPNYHAVEVDETQDLILKNGVEESRVLVLQGKPINEPVVQHGPFVMNTRQEIQDAFEDYHKTQFGGWPWPKYDQVHARNLGRFAKHANGKIEEKE